MAFSCTVTAGITWTPSMRSTAAGLNATALPTVTIADGSLPADALDADDFVSTFAASFGAVNWLPWGTFFYDAFLAATTTCAVSTRTEPHENWWVIPTGAAVDAERSARSSANTALEGGRVALKVKGAASLTAVRAGTYLPPALASPLFTGNLTFSIYVWNSTGASITPNLEVSSSDSAGDEGTVTLRSTVSGSACSNGAWTRVSYAIDASAITNWNNGVRLGLLFTVAANQLDVSTDYVLLADAQIDKGATVATTHVGVPYPVQQVPAGTMFPYGGATAPPGWLLCDGTAVSRTVYARLFQAISTAHGTGDGSTTFNLPDGRGRSFAGAEVAGSSQSRLETSMSATGTSGEYTLTVTSTGVLRLGMGAYGTGIATGAYITGLTATVITLSAVHTATVNGTVRFGKLGASADPESVGSAGSGMSYGRNEVKLTQKGCSTATTTTLTVQNALLLACGMTVSSDAGDIPAGTTIDAILSTTTVRLTAAATGTNSNITVTFGVDAPEGNQWERFQYLLENPKMPVIVDVAADTTIHTPAGCNGLIHSGMTLTAAAGAGLVAGTYVDSVDTADGDNFDINPATSGATPGTYDVTFTGATLSRTSTPVPDSVPAFLGNWIIKT